LFNGHRMSEGCARWVFGLVFAGTNIAFFPMHISGLLGMPRRVYTYGSEMGWAGLNLASTVGALLLAAGVALFTLDLVRTLRRPQKAHDNPWRASSLEWLPQDEYATRSQPEVRSAEPLWRQALLVEEVESGMHWLPGSVTGMRETLVTGWRDARPRHLLVLPGDSWLPFLCALGTAGFFLLMTMQLAVAAWLFGALAIVTLLAWLWRADRPLAAKAALVAEGVVLPVGAKGAASHSWWATWVLVVVDAAIFVSLAFTLLHLSMRLEACPPPGAHLPLAPWPWLPGALVAASSALAWWNGRRAGQWWPMLAAGGCLVVAFTADLGSHLSAGLVPSRNAWSAAVAALLAYQGLHVAVLAPAAIYVAARGKLREAGRATLDNTILLWHCAVGQALAGLALLQLL